ncbi:glycosyltransferase family 4 protein [Clostridium gasigenes]|uniref:glycosyltransferase family 4 protein n=1 Tax=Clostridium gasigenes TaxID=94869 RepID=UPI001C0C1372|nr:glycosyltransferase family 4 protein [Clostridium gasigenes]MBU3138163.1 glycosyltransferase family 4 protein [Clostridium gasigenes]
MKKVLFLTTRLIYPVNDGRKVVLYNYCKGLELYHDCEVRLFSILDDEEKRVEQPTFISKVYYGSLPNKLEKIMNLSIKSVLLNKWPLQVSLYYSKKTKKNLDEVINEYNPDVVICDMARTAEYFKDLNDEKYNKILDMDDILSKRYKRQMESGELGKDAVGAYASKLPKCFDKWIDRFSAMKYILGKEVKILSKYEEKISQYYRNIVFVSPLEAKEFGYLLGEAEKTIDITIGVDYSYFSQEIIQEKIQNSIVFLGNMHVSHNKDAVNHFLENIYPGILKEIPNAKLIIVGRCPEDYKNHLLRFSNIEVTGEVDDIRLHVKKCSVAIAPLLYGSGIKTKILETMAMGIPVVTNDIGIEGIALTDGENILVANTSEDFINKTIDLLINRELNNKILCNAKRFIQENHQWKDILKKFEGIL